MGLLPCLDMLDLIIFCLLTTISPKANKKIKIPLYISQYDKYPYY
jgi:hypothetical protein